MTTERQRPPLFLCVAPSGLEPALGQFRLAMGERPFDLFDEPTEDGEPDFEARRGVVDLGGWGRREHTSRAADAGVELWHVLGYGLDHLDLGYLLERDVTVAHTPGNCSAVALAEHAMLLLLGCARRIGVQRANLDSGVFWHPWSDEIAGRRLLLLGVGASGRELARRAAAFEMDVVGIDVVAPDAGELAGWGVRSLSPPEALHELLATADAVSLHLPLTDATHHVLDRRAFAALKPGAVVVNVARGALIDEVALLEALDSGQVAAAGLDVFEHEEPGRRPDVAGHPRVFGTPHTAGVTFDTSQRRSRLVADNLARLERGEPVQHQVQKDSVLVLTGDREARVVQRTDAGSGYDAKVDLVCFGRTCVDLYAQQQGAPLHAVESFAKYVGGSAANICVACARLGLRTAMLTRVGEEAFGDFVVASLAAEGVDTRLVQRDARRPTGVVTLALRPSDDFPRLFLYADSPDLAVDAADVDFSLVRGARAVLLTGSMLITDELAALSLRLAEEVHDAGGRVVLDADFRPVLWGLAPIGQGNRMSAQSGRLSAAYARVLPMCDLVVGTGEEIEAMTGVEGRPASLEALLAATPGTVVAKAGLGGSTLYPAGERDGAPMGAAAFPVEVVNTVGAGDAFLGGFLGEWLRRAPPQRCLRAGNAGGAIVASRHGCMTAMPVRAELDRFLHLGGVRRPDDDAEIERLHRVGTRPATPRRLFVLAIDHRWQLEAIADETGAPYDRLCELKRLLAQAFLAVAVHRDDCGILADDRYAAAVLEQMAGSRYFTARAMDVPRSRPVELLAGDEVEAHLRGWPADQVVKVMCYAHPGDDATLARRQASTLARVGAACRSARRELLVELQVPAGRSYEASDLAELVAALYGHGVRPEWWKLPALPDPRVWSDLAVVIGENDPSCRGVLVLGATAAPEEIASSFVVLAEAPLVRGFAIGRAIFADAARSWLAGELAGDDLMASVAGRYGEMIAAWGEAERAANRRLVEQ